MSRSWREERTTPKIAPKKAPRPRVGDFAREYYQGKGYPVEALQDEYCDACDSRPCEGVTLDCKRDIYAT